MKLLSRDFTGPEKALLLVLCLILLALAYYRFVDIPVREEIADAQAEKESLQTELRAVNTRISKLEAMQKELDTITQDGRISRMESYNNEKEELALLNGILGAADKYTIHFTGVTRSGDQIRRNFTLQFTTEDYDAMLDILTALSQSRSRCLVGDLRCSDSSGSPEKGNSVTVSMTATFFETMVGGTPDAGLPESH